MKKINKRRKSFPVDGEKLVFRMLFKLRFRQIMFLIVKKKFNLLTFKHLKIMGFLTGYVGKLVPQIGIKVKTDGIK